MPTRDKVVVRLSPGMSRAAGDALRPSLIRVCLCWRLFQRISLIGLFLWLSEVLGPKSVVMIFVDVKGSMIALLS